MKGNNLAKLKLLITFAAIFIVKLSFNYQYAYSGILQDTQSFFHYGLTQYGIVIDNQCGNIIDASMSNSHLSLHISFPRKETFCGVLDGNTLKGTFKGQGFEILFNRDGTGRGFLSDSRPISVIVGKKSTQSEIDHLVDELGAMPQVQDLMRKNKFPGDNAIGYYVHEEMDFIQATYVYATGFEHPIYGVQPKIRSIVAKRRNSVWQVSERIL